MTTTTDSPDVKTVERDGRTVRLVRKMRPAGRLADQPVIPIGRAMGVLRARGDMEAPTKGQIVAMDGESIRQHVIIFGGTGEGKTRDTVRPLFKRLAAAVWSGRQIGAYVTCGKGTLPYDLLPVLADRNDVIVIGTKPGEYGVDLLRGMTPLEVSTILKAVSGQVMGEAGGDPFWPEMASLLTMHAACLALALDGHPDLSDAFMLARAEAVEAARQVGKLVPAPQPGQTLAPGQVADWHWTDEWTDARPWSLVGIARIATDADCLAGVADQIEEMIDTGASAGQPLPADYLAAVRDEEVRASAKWFRGSWACLAGETKGSIVANVNVVLGKLTGAGELRRRFCTGRYPKLADVKHALYGGVVAVGVGETEWGMVGKVIAVWLKTRFYIEARKKLQREGAAVCARHSCALFMDEAQMLMTVGPDSDATFWNIARETGVFMVAATQSLAALKQSLGEVATANLINLLRTKIVLRTEELSTLEFCSQIAGETLRGIVVDDEMFETQAQREMERPDLAPHHRADRELTLARVLPTSPGLGTQGMRGAVGLDTRFIREDGEGSEQNSSKQAAYWRQEDKEREIRGAGLERRPKITADELLLGGGIAFALVQRAGGKRCDLIDLRL